MSDQAVRDRWRALAEELGLPPDENAAPAKPTGAAPPVPVEAAEEEDVFEEARGEIISEPAHDFRDEAYLAESELPPIARLDPLVLDEGPEFAARMEGQLAEREAVAAEDKPRGRGRRRGGRRGRRDRSREPDRRREDSNDTSPAQDEDNLDESGRGARHDQPAAETAPPAEEDDFEDIPSDWNVPSWNELIASLYRPER